MMMYSCLTCLPLFTVSRTIPANNNNFKKNVDNNFNMDNRLLFEEEFEGNSKDSIYFQDEVSSGGNDKSATSSELSVRSSEDNYFRHLRNLLRTSSSSNEAQETLQDSKLTRIQELLEIIAFRTLEMDVYLQDQKRSQRTKRSHQSHQTARHSKRTTSAPSLVLYPRVG